MSICITSFLSQFEVRQFLNNFSTSTANLNLVALLVPSEWIRMFKVKHTWKLCTRLHRVLKINWVVSLFKTNLYLLAQYVAWLILMFFLQFWIIFLYSTYERYLNDWRRLFSFDVNACVSSVVSENVKGCNQGFPWLISRRAE